MAKSARIWQSRGSSLMTWQEAVLLLLGLGAADRRQAYGGTGSMSNLLRELSDVAGVDERRRDGSVVCRLNAAVRYEG